MIGRLEPEIRLAGSALVGTYGKHCRAALDIPLISGGSTTLPHD
jgi:hypothetical protein